MLIPLKHNITRSFFFLFLSLLLTGCGGGGGGGSSPPRQTPQPQPDTTPDNFSFESQAGVELGVQAISNSVIIQGIDAEVPVSIEGGEYSLDDGDFTDQSGTLTQGQKLVLLLTAAEEFGTQTSATVTVGGVSARFEVTTKMRDATPDSFSLSSAIGVEPGEEFFSDVITVSGINTAVPVTVTGGQYRIDEGECTDTESTLSEGQTIQVKGIAPSEPNASHNVELTIGTRTELFTITTRAPSTTPDDFNFAPQTGVDRGALVTSNPVIIEGIEVEVPITIEGGDYALDGGAFTDQDGILAPGQSLVLRVSAAETFITQTSVTVTLGGMSARFDVTTRGPDTVPESFSFEPQTGVELGSEVTSNSVAIEGIEAGVPISVEGGDYALDGGSFTDETGTASPGQSLALRLTAAEDFEVQTSATVTVGSVSARFEVTTEARDITPEGFSFAPVSGVNPETEVVSDVITVSGINTEVSITVTGGQYRIGEGEYTDAEGTVTEGQAVQVKATAPSELDASIEVELTIGALSELFTITTRPPSTTPDSFSFTSKVDVTPNTWVLSDTVTVTGITEAVPVSIDNGQYRIDEQAFTQEAGSIEEGQKIQVRHLTADTLATETVSTLTIGEVDGAFNTTTSESFDNTPPEWALASEFPAQQLVTTLAGGATSVFPADLDGDGDQDVVSASSDDNTIAWYESDGSADPLFTRRVITTSARGAQSVFVVDVDGDGDQDLLSGSWYGDTVAWYENDGADAPTFTERVIATDADARGVRSVFAVDLDGDGDTDILSASDLDDTIAWYENDGATGPTFTERTITTDADGAQSVFAADLDGDGDMDILSASNLDDTISWYENDDATDPTFTERTITTGADGAQSVFAADLDGDGDMDVLSASAFDDTLVWYENDGADAPTFTERVITTVADGAQSVFAADLDGDGDMDVLSASSDDDTVAWYENDGVVDPTFAKRAIATDADGAQSVLAADLDGDGALEVLAASRLDNTIAWYNPTQRLYWLAEGESLNVTENATDADSNLLTYAISHGADAGFFSVNASTGELTFADAPSVSEPQDANADNVYEVWLSVTDGFSTINRPVSVRVFVDDEDDDNDGVPDTEDAFPLDPTESVDTDMDGIGNNADPDDDNDGVEDEEDNVPLNASSAFRPEWVQTAELPTQQVITTNADGASSVFAADLDGDGDQDVLSASEDDGTIAWYESDGAAQPEFIWREITTFARGAHSVFAADVDGDGDLDVLSASENDDTIAWYENDGAADPAFTERTVTTDADVAQSVFAADLDGDGDMDLLSASFNDDAIAWYESDGAVDPVFTKRVITTVADGAKSVFAADLDGDGDLDVISASEEEDAIAWYENDGVVDPEFARLLVTKATKGAQWVSAADVDGDGDMDLLSASFVDDTIAWHENDGAADPVFTERVITTDPHSARLAFAVDVDGDGDLDVLSASFNDNTIAWYENDGATDPGFTERKITMDANGARSAFAADLDGDGGLELLSASFWDNTIAWYRTTQRHYQVVEGDTLMVLENASDMDGNLLSYAVSHGADAGFFTIDATTGDLTFADAPPVSSPEDANGDNIYDVWISVSDGFSTLMRSIAVEVQAAN